MCRVESQNTINKKASHVHTRRQTLLVDTDVSIEVLDRGPIH